MFHKMDLFPKELISITGKSSHKYKLYKPLVNGMSATDVTGNREVKLVAKQTQNGTIIQRKVTVFCINQNNNQDRNP
jgi:hypothetical protein